MALIKLPLELVEFQSANFIHLMNIQGLNNDQVKMETEIDLWKMLLFSWTILPTLILVQLLLFPNLGHHPVPSSCVLCIPLIELKENVQKN